MTTLLSDDLLATIRGRAAIHDRENSFFADDLDDLRTAGYLGALVPTSTGGRGLSLRELCHEQSRLAGAAPATALAVNMHHVWTGVARYLHERGDDTLDWLLAEAAAGEVFGFGYSEAGNDLVLLGSRTEARPDGEGGYTFHGRKIFTSNSPGWTRLGVMGLDSTTDPDDPRIVHAFITRDGGGFEILDDWDTIGMRASQSCTTVLDGAHAPAERVMRRIAPGPSLDPYVLGIFTSFEILLAAVYAGIADRALELAVSTVERRTSMKTGKAYSQDPDIRRRIAAAALAQDGIWPQIDQIAGGIDALEDRGAGWFRATSGLKIRATETARDVVDEAIRCSGGSTYFHRSELGRLYRDVLAGIFQPSDDESAHAQVAQSLLGPLRQD
ncbi:MULTISPECIES: acyl-CoA dehydrogenase family protein [unclassified Isoptericola]|uniref:acyl-CoA dehydrogenase family protein n=1 Tax=unclassified Isoptericola TaxID=2623355 RepID=UPI0027124380|nr:MULTISPECIES: acyl-CoA dehydrogenase family protein [unclassified Isoptericola]MDO8145458.1 acyl-CoA dehydrogenase family protein [Isoptericola sp. 178]MDO8149099.1 acyl-CoA dehydrogenase family protein [Isoptericola sp. b515]MDO8150961.1 acyl-CoA dehydrogenase family protein [Isoptericola sp. b408]